MSTILNIWTFFSGQWTARVSKQAQIQREMATRQKEMENTGVNSELETVEDD